jgi:calcium-dependent protein kinase
VDFGLSSRIDIEKLEFPKCGTPGYVAPEVINYKDKYNEKCDMFSIGVIMYKL